MTNDEVRNMIGRALDGEPPVGLAFETVLDAGRRRRTRRTLGIVGGAVLGVVAVASVAVTVNQFSTASQVTDPAVTDPPPAGCVVPVGTRGYLNHPAGTASPEELAESARLTEAFRRYDLRLPPGVTMDPAQPRLCAIDHSWGTSFVLRTADSERRVTIEVAPRGGPLPADCSQEPADSSGCAVTMAEDGTAVVVHQPVPRRPQSSPPLMMTPMSMAARRLDGTTVRVEEADVDITKPKRPILTSPELMRLLMAPELKVNWTKAVTPAAPTAAQAEQMSIAVAKAQWQPEGMRQRIVPNSVAGPMTFYVSQGGYKLNADLVDAAGEGNLFINLSPPEAGVTEVDCRGQVNCYLESMSDGHRATVTRQVDGYITRLTVNTIAADGTQVMVMCSNLSAKSGTAGGTRPTRPEPPLSITTLLQLATVPGLHW